MARKKAKRVIAKKRRPILDKTFNCPVCSHEKAIDCKLEHSSKVGTATCRMCNAKFTTPITKLDCPIDVYSKWIDTLENKI